MYNLPQVKEKYNHLQYRGIKTEIHDTELYSSIAATRCDKAYF